MTIRKLDADHYAIAYDGDLYRAHHSDVAGLALVSVQNLNDDKRQYLYLDWKLSNDGQRLTIRTISGKVIDPRERNSATIAKLIAENRDNPALFNDTGEYVREKENTPPA